MTGGARLLLSIVSYRSLFAQELLLQHCAFAAYFSSPPYGSVMLCDVQRVLLILVKDPIMKHQTIPYSAD